MVHADVLISKVTKCLPQEIEDARKHNWDAVFVSQFLYDLKKFKKRGQKERRHKEAQAVLATATADAAASSRNSSLRKDTVDDSAHQEVVVIDSYFINIKLSYSYPYYVFRIF